MKNDTQRMLIQSMLDIAGVQIDGDRPFDIQVNDPRLYSAVLGGGTLGLGEAYMDGWWDCPAWTSSSNACCCGAGEAHAPVKALLWAALKARMLNPQRPHHAFEIGEHHYDIGNDLYVKMLDQRMIYTCGYWAMRPSTLDEAQEAKLDLICRKLDLRDGHAGARHRLRLGRLRHVRGREVRRPRHGRHRLAGADRSCAGALQRDLPVDFRLMDYRKHRRVVRPDRVHRHVRARRGKNYRTFMEVGPRALATTASAAPHHRPQQVRPDTDPWIEKYIFPNAMIPSLEADQHGGRRALHPGGLAQLRRGLRSDADGLVQELRRQLGPVKHDYDERFYRMWKYYLLACAASFRVRRHQVWQVVLSPKGVRGGYRGGAVGACNRQEGAPPEQGPSFLSAVMSSGDGLRSRNLQRRQRRRAPSPSQALFLRPRACTCRPRARRSGTRRTCRSPVQPRPLCPPLSA